VPPSSPRPPQVGCGSEWSVAPGARSRSVTAACSAEAAEAAAAQDRFWEMHDQLYEHQQRLRVDDLRSYAQAIALDLELFDKELEEHVHADRVHEDFLSGVRSGVNGTPTFFINGVRHDDAYEFETLLAALNGSIGVGADHGGS